MGKVGVQIADKNILGKQNSRITKKNISMFLRGTVISYNDSQQHSTNLGAKILRSEALNKEDALPDSWCITHSGDYLP